MSDLPRCNTVGFLSDLLAHARIEVAAQILFAEHGDAIPPTLLAKIMELLALTEDAVEVIGHLPRSTPWRG